MAFSAAAFGCVALVGIEIALVMRREFLPTEPALVIDGSYGEPDGRPLRFAVLGDSTAAGLGAGRADLAYPVLLAEKLAEDGYLVELIGLGVSGARVRDVLTLQVPAAEELRPDIVFVCIGANDVTHLTSLSAISDGMEKVFDRLLATGAIVVGSDVPDMRADAFPEPLRSLSGWRGREVSGEIRAVARARGVPVVPLAERTGPFFASDPDEAYASDLFHPGPGGYNAWAEAIYPTLSEALNAH